MKVNIIGSGIAGPMAAITLGSLGHTVDVWETRQAAELHSDGILGINAGTVSTLSRYAVSGAFERFLPYSGADYRFITWTDLHRSLTESAERYGGVRFHYGRAYEDYLSSDLVIQATGVGSAKEVVKPSYTGYVIYRGLSPYRAGTPWVWQQMDGWKVAAGDTRLGASITAFIPRDHAVLKTTYTQDMPPEFHEFVKWHSLKNRMIWNWDRLLKSVPQWLVQPMSDWDVPSQMIRGNTVRIGDANGQLRPQTSMGANLAIKEASDFSLLVNRSREAERRHLEEKTQWHFEGIKRGV
jgi:2-polyprenyl-6-methoxyphenol hydroxylase-like FAD-dependent oxidoreductase